MVFSILFLVTLTINNFMGPDLLLIQNIVNPIYCTVTCSTKSNRTEPGSNNLVYLCCCSCVSSSIGEAVSEESVNSRERDDEDEFASATRAQNC